MKRFLRAFPGGKSGTTARIFIGKGNISFTENSRRGKERGSLASEVFTLKGNGKIGFLIGGGADTEKCYVALCDESGNELVKRANTGFGAAKFHDGMYRVILDGSQYVGQKVYIKIVDNDGGTEGIITSTPTILS